MSDSSLPTPGIPASSTGACEVCHEVRERLFSFCAHYQRDLGVDPEIHTAFLQSHGLCSGHTWWLEWFSSPRGLCESYPDLLEQLAKRMNAICEDPNRDFHNSLVALLPGPGTCPACLALDEAERRCITRLQSLLNPEGPEEGTRPSLCLSHLVQVLDGCDSKVAKLWVESTAARLLEAAAGMRRYGLKFDARQRNLLTAEESSSARLALELVSGDKNLAKIGKH